ncbi:DUF2971 domain-containing protein [Dyadobacter frigoris]|uniref:DUF2971 domain-containing protein n=1 Tax=Dyadobacter frigoris TaxID=2576211 RepID=A0A4U6D7I0_9BACT|nr:DUF2971 domain-containing protein [Dyadobacter frigoris]TKT93352.1 DUF2971 domain-containing protein [Dyadobacter frigoris]GLU54664.1 hypothetical protein Dfri01_41250 [Dyadobacter frigoris]
MKIFKYLPPDRIDVILNQNIRFTQPHYLNDTFETIPYLSGIDTAEKIDDLFDKEIPKIISGQDILNNLSIGLEEVFKINPEIDPNAIIDILNTVEPDKLLSTLVKPVLKALNLQPTNDDLAEKFRERFQNKLGILSLTQRNDNLLMWAHYTQSDTGFVIEFNHSGDLLKNRKSSIACLNEISEVRYKKERPELYLFKTLTPNQEWIEELAGDVFLTKGLSWQYEQELRVVKGLQECSCVNESLGIFLYHFDAAEISNIYMGMKIGRAPEERIKGVLAESRYGHVGLFKAFQSSKEYRMDFRKLI